MCNTSFDVNIDSVYHSAQGHILLLPCSAYYKPMGDLSYISSEQGGRIIRTDLIYEFPYISVLYLQELRAGKVGGFIIHLGP